MKFLFFEKNVDDQDRNPASLSPSFCFDPPAGHPGADTVDSRGLPLLENLGVDGDFHLVAHDHSPGLDRLVPGEPEILPVDFRGRDSPDPRLPLAIPLVTPRMVRSPVILSFPSPAFSTFFDLNTREGYFAASRKSGLFRCSSRLATRVLMEEASMVMSAEDLEMPRSS